MAARGIHLFSHLWNSVRPHAGVLLAHPHEEGCLTSSTIAISPTTCACTCSSLSAPTPTGVWQAVRAEIARLLADHRLDHVTVQRTEEPPGSPQEARAVTDKSGLLHALMHRSAWRWNSTKLNFALTEF